MGRTARYMAGWWLSFIPLYLLFASKLSWGEGLAALVLAGLAAVAITATRWSGQLGFQAQRDWLPHLLHLPRRVLTDCGVVAAALWRAVVRREKVEGAFRTVPFEPGGDDATSAARRALVVAGASLAPNTYVVGVDARRGLLLVHQLVPTATPPGDGDREWPL